MLVFAGFEDHDGVLQTKPMGMDVACCLGVRVKEKLATPIATPPHKSLLNKHKKTTYSLLCVSFFLYSELKI